MEDDYTEGVRLVTAVLAFGFSLYYYSQGSIFASGMMAGVSGVALIRFTGYLLNQILE